MPYKRFAALAIFITSMAVYFACNPDNGEAPANRPDNGKSPVATEATGINWKKDWSAAKSEAASTGKLVMIDFYTDWCGWCKVLDQKTFPDARVIKASTQLIALKSNAEREGQSQAKEYGIRGFPAILFVDAAGKAHGRLDGFYPPEEFAPKMQRIIDDYNRSKQ